MFVSVFIGLSMTRFWNAENRLKYYHPCLTSMSQSAPTELLPALLALLETESVTLAAQRLHVGQPAMSRTLEKLREATGDALLVREGRRLVRTRRALELLPELGSLLAAAQRVLTPSAAFQPRQARGVVTLGLGDDMQAVLVAPLLARLRSEAPGLDIRIRPIHLNSAHEASRGMIELAVMPDIRNELTLSGLSELVLSPVYTRRFISVSRTQRKLTLQSFLAADHVLVSPQGNEGGYVDDALRLAGQKRRVAVTVPGFLAALSLVQSSDLLATLPDDIVHALAPALHRYTCPVATPELSMCVIWAARFTHDARHSWLRAQVREVLRDTMASGTKRKRR
jgi:DNA-binding transcriptional LysR family regulator